MDRRWWERLKEETSSVPNMEMHAFDASGLDGSSGSMPCIGSAEKLLQPRCRVNSRALSLILTPQMSGKKFLPLKFCNKVFTFSSDWLGGFAPPEEFSLRQIGVRDLWLG